MPDITTNISYLQWRSLYETEKPFLCFVDIPEDAEDKRDNNLFFEDRLTTIFDLRPMISKHTLDDNGFMIRSQDVSAMAFDVETIERTYLPKVETLIKEEVEGAKRVFFFDWKVNQCFIVL